MDKNNVIRFVIGLVIGFIISFFIAKSLVRTPQTVISDGKKTVVVKLVTKIDTMYVKQNTVEYRVVDRPTERYVDSVYDNSNKIVTAPVVKRIYADSVKVADSTYVGYKAHVTGTLDNIKLSYSNRKSIVVIHKTDSVFTETTIKKPSKGLYLGVALGLTEVSPTLQYVHNKNMFGVKYNIVSPGILPVEKIGVTYSRKLF